MKLLLKTTFFFAAGSQVRVQTSRINPRLTPLLAYLILQASWEKYFTTKYFIFLLLDYQTIRNVSSLNSYFYRYLHSLMIIYYHSQNRNNYSCHLYSPFNISEPFSYSYTKIFIFYFNETSILSHIDNPSAIV